VRGIIVMALLAGGCSARSPEKVQIVAARAAEDPSEVRRLARALSHRKRPVWEEAYGALVELGPSAVPELRESVERRRPEAGRALLVLGEMGDPGLAPLLRAAAEVRSLEAFARAGLELCEGHSWERLQDEPDSEQVDSFLEQFPRGPHLDEARVLQRELEAWAELDAVATGAPEGALIRIDRLYGETPAGAEARRRLARTSLSRAAEAIARGRGAEALRLVDEARDWDPSQDVEAMEAAARAAAGAEMAGRDLDGALTAMTAALAISGKPHPEMGALYLRRARRNFKRRRPAEGMADLAGADAVMSNDAELAAAVEAERAGQVEGLLATAERPDAAGEVFAALLLAGRGWWASLENALRWHLARGDGRPVAAVVEAAWSHGGADERGWTEALLTQLLFEVDGVIRGLLDDPAALAALMDPGEIWSEAALAARAEAAPLLGAYVDVVGAALAHESAGGLVDGALPAGAPRARAEVLRRLEDGADPRAAGLPRLDRAQLLRVALEELDDLERLARRRPASVVAALGTAEIPPRDALDWVRWAGPAREAGAEARMGSDLWGVTVVQRAGTVRIEIAGPPGPVSQEAAADGLTALLTAGQPLLAASPGASRVELLLGSTHPTYGTLDPRVRLALTRQQYASMDWDWIADQAPLGWSHLALVPDRSVR